MRRGRLLEYLTIGWNLLEGVTAAGSGLVAGSAALVGFGVDSFIESLPGGALLWRLRLFPILNLICRSDRPATKTKSIRAS